MQTNQYGQTYVGNDDFRGWLAAGNTAPLAFNNELAKMGVDANNILLQHAGNDGGVDTDDKNVASLADYYYNYWNNQRQGNINQAGNYNGSASATSADDATLKKNMVGIYDRQIADINNNLGSLNSQLDNALANIRGQYDQYKNEQQSSYNAAENDYNNSTRQNQQSLQANRNNITKNASNGLRGLLRTLGAMGAGGGSVARYEAPAMVTNQANQEYSNAGQTYAQNQQSLDTNWGNYKNEYENDKKKLDDWYDGQVKNAKQENYEKGQSLLSDLVTAYGNRAQYGGSYGNNINDAYDRIANYRSRINDLGKFTTPNYTGETPIYNAPDLAAYNTNNTNLATTVADSNTSASSPLLTALQNLNKKKTNSPYNTTED